MHTLVDFHVRNGLPFVHSYEPSWFLAVCLLPTTAQIYDELSLVAAQCRKNSVQARLAEVRLRKEVGCNDDLLIIAIVSLRSSSLHIS